MRKIEKYVKDGKVGVLYSPSYGAGWSSWSHTGGDFNEFLIFDKTLVQMALDKEGVEEVDRYIKLLWGEKAHFYPHGWRNIEVEWLDPGTEFLIHEYDGYESVWVKSELHWNKA